MRSISSASPPAVGKTSTGWPQCPQRTRLISCPTRLEYHLEAVFIAARPFLLAPALHPTPEELGELVDLVGRKKRGDLLVDGVAHGSGAEKAVGELVELAEVLAAEIAELFGLEALTCDPGIGAKSLARIKVTVGDRVERLPIEVAPHLAAGGRAEDRPAQIGLDQPGEMVVERCDLAIRAGIGKIDRVPDAVLGQSLARIEIPT